MKPGLSSFLNPVRMLKAWRFRRETRKYDRSAFDLELYLYAQILRNDMLHYGFFDDDSRDPGTISIADIEMAQEKYVSLILRELNISYKAILDVGCGMGGLTVRLREAGHMVEALTPDDRQYEYVSGKIPGLKIHHCRFQDLETAQRYGTVIHAESLQYIPLEQAIAKTAGILEVGGRWIVTDYFRIQDGGVNRSGHLLDDFRRKLLASGNWRIEEERDITLNVLPTLRVADFYVKRFLLPLKHFGEEKLRFKRPWWYYMTEDLRKTAQAKIEKEMAAVDPELFSREKRYMLFVIQKTTANERSES